MYIWDYEIRETFELSIDNLDLDIHCRALLF